MNMGLLAGAKPSDDAARRYLKQAIDLHEKHMNGTAPTTGPAGEKSQREMMRLMMLAYQSMGGNPNKLVGLLGM